jgi:hypothetical protein
MHSASRFGAPWPKLLIAISFLGTVLLLLATGICLAVLPPRPAGVRVAVAALPLAIVLGCLLFAVRGYVLTDRELLIQRLGWVNRWPLARLQSVTVDPQAMRGSLRLWGNGGLFAFCGWFRNRKLGIYRAFATDPQRSVVLRFGPRTIVITPDNPTEFVHAIQSRCPGVQTGWATDSISSRR